MTQEPNWYPTTHFFSLTKMLVSKFWKVFFLNDVRRRKEKGRFHLSFINFPLNSTFFFTCGSEISCSKQAFEKKTQPWVVFPVIFWQQKSLFTTCVCDDKKWTTRLVCLCQPWDEALTLVLLRHPEMNFSPESLFNNTKTWRVAPRDGYINVCYFKL